jgi:hydroxymethylglutaryl-CoA reductase
MTESSRPSSRFPGFYKLPMEERVRVVAERWALTPAEVAVLRAEGALPHATADHMSENVVGTFPLPLGLGLNFLVNGKDYVVPMVVEEPSVVAAVSLAAKIARDAGGYTAQTDPSHMVGQVQVTRYGDAQRATDALLSAREEILALANSVDPGLVRAGGGARDVRVRQVPAPEGADREPILVLEITVDTRDAMGANAVNTMAEAVGVMAERLTGGKVFLRILSNLADQRLARASCRIPVKDLAEGDTPGERMAEGILQASRFAEADPYRAATHNKGIMNGIDALAIATGNDWRAVEAGAHAYAARSGAYRPLSTWRVEEDHLVGRITLPLALGIVGGPIRVHPTPRVCLKVMGITSARELAGVMAAVGLAQNFSAVRALGSVGIQRGHMALHARCVAITAGARGDDVDRVTARLVEGRAIQVDAAREIMRQLGIAPPH